jgi:sugar diacid utilization regulator
MLKIFALVPFIMTGIIGTLDPTTNSFVEYGALGICGFSMLMLFRQLSDQRASHRSERESLVLALQQQNDSHRLEREALISNLNASNERVIAMLEKSIRTDEKFTQAMNDRPCLVRKPE